MKFRHLHVKKELLKTIFEAETNPIIVIDIITNEHEYYNVLNEKIEAIWNSDWTNRMLFVWEWKDKTDVFELRSEDILNILDLF